MNEITIPNPKAFISYAWSSKQYEEKVIAFCTSLIDSNIDVILDKWELKEGNDTYAFMERSVTDSSVTNVLILLDNNYALKANERKGGVGTETQIISPEVYGKVLQSKFIPIVFERDENNNVCKPAYLKSSYHIDLSEQETYDENFQYLVKKLFGVEVYQKPKLGVTPSYVTNNTTASIKTIVAFDELRKTNNSNVSDELFIKYLKEINKGLLDYDTSKISNGEKGNVGFASYLDCYKGTKHIRDNYLKLLTYSIYCKTDIVKRICSFLEQILNEVNAQQISHKEIKLILIHEMFLYTVAFYLKKCDYKNANYILEKTYFSNKHGNVKPKGFEVFYTTEFSFMDSAVCQRDNKRYYSGVAQYWIENINSDFYDRSDFVLADIICHNFCVFAPDRHFDDRNWLWFPLTYCYGGRFENNVLDTLAVKLESKEHLEQLIHLFGYSNESDFIEKYKDIEQQYNDGKIRRYRFDSAFDEAPLLIDSIKSDKIGTLN